MTVNAYPLEWPLGWKRIAEHERTAANFGKAGRYENNGDQRRWISKRNLTNAEAVGRVRETLGRMRIDNDDLVVSSNLALRLDGWPRDGQREPDDPGVAVYWRIGTGEMRCMAIDRYDRVADNLAAIAATLEAMRAIERHGGAAILDRAFTGFTALPPPMVAESPWYTVLDVEPNDKHETVKEVYRWLRSEHHPDRGGDAEQFNRVQKAWDQYQAQRHV